MWPTVVNTMLGGAGGSKDFLNVAKVLRFSPLKKLSEGDATG